MNCSGYMKSTAFIESMDFPKDNVYGFLTGQLKQFTGTGVDPGGLGGLKIPSGIILGKPK